MVGGIWGQTRSYGDAYHWGVHDATVASLSAVSVFFSGGSGAGGQGTKWKQIFPSPAAQRFLIDGRMRRVFARQGTLVPATPGWEICGPRNLTGLNLNELQKEGAEVGPSALRDLLFIRLQPVRVHWRAHPCLDRGVGRFRPIAGSTFVTSSSGRTLQTWMVTQPVS